MWKVKNKMKEKIAKQLESLATQFNELLMCDQNVILKMLYQALADQWLAYYQYWAAYNKTVGKGKTDVDPQFQEHATEELEHADKIIQRIKQLGGCAFSNVKCFDKNCSVPNVGAPTNDPIELLKITIKAQQDAISFYKNLQKITRGVDPTTNRMIKQILEDQEKHEYDLKMLLTDIED